MTRKINASARISLIKMMAVNAKPATKSTKAAKNVIKTESA